MMKAHKRLNDYLSRRIVPEDLKGSGFVRRLNTMPVKRLQKQVSCALELALAEATLQAESASVGA